MTVSRRRQPRSGSSRRSHRRCRFSSMALRPAPGPQRHSVARLHADGQPRPRARHPGGRWPRAGGAAPHRPDLCQGRHDSHRDRAVGAPHARRRPLRRSGNRCRAGRRRHRRHLCPAPERKAVLLGRESGSARRSRRCRCWSPALPTCARSPWAAWATSARSSRAAKSTAGGRQRRRDRQRHREPTPIETPTAVRGIGSAVQVAVGGHHACALLADGSVACWGSGADGELGNGQLGSSSSIPVRSPGFTPRGRSAPAAPTPAPCSQIRATCWGHQSQVDSLGFAHDSAVPVPVEVSCRRPRSPRALHTLARCSRSGRGVLGRGQRRRARRGAHRTLCGPRGGGTAVRGDAGQRRRRTNMRPAAEDDTISAGAPDGFVGRVSTLPFPRDRDGDRLSAATGMLAPCCTTSRRLLGKMPTASWATAGPTCDRLW